jgi:metallo-beta-lactamase family protein
MAEVKITFYGGVGKVTGANFMLESGDQKSLVDCGLIQGPKWEMDRNKEPFKYNPKEVNELFVTHGHIDHIGRIGKLIKDGFTGTIYSTPATRDIAELMLEDAVKVQTQDNKEPLYDMGHVNKALSLWKTIPYYKETEIGNYKVTPKDAGHVLGSCIYEFIHKDSGKKIVFTGDLGNTPTPLLKDTDKIEGVDYMVIESVYGDRNHENRDSRTERLKRELRKVIDRGGTIIIPVFSLEKTQVLLHELNDLIEDGHLPSVPVFLDSPLGIKLTDVYSRYLNNYNEHIQKEIKDGDDIFDFPKLKMTLHRSESENIIKTQGPKIIIASSGMSEGGRITSHEKKYLPDPKNALIVIGYQIAGTIGRQIRDGKKEVTVGETTIPINAEIIKVDGYSSHKDSDGLLEFVADSSETLKKVFVAMGEPKSSLHFVQKVRDYLDVKAIAPEEGDSFTLK